MSDTLIKIRGLRFSRGERMILDGVDMDIPRKGVTAIMGPSGTGKTTLLKLIAGMDMRCKKCGTETGGMMCPKCNKTFGV